MGDLSALERLNRTTEVMRTPQSPVRNPSLNSDPYDPQDIINTPNGPVVIHDGRQVPLQELDSLLLAQGWSDDADVDFSLTPEGEHVAGSANH
jgi:hypothetical protein